MLLAVDVGNSHTVIGLYDGESLVRHWRMASRREATVDEVEVLLRQFLGSWCDKVRDAIVASVVPILTSIMIDALARLTGVTPLDVAPGIKTGLRIRTDNPQELGADRIVNAVAALAVYGGPAVIVDLGTATTLDVVTADGDYLGGIICPGPQLGADALSVRAARLPRVELSVPPKVVGRNTVDSMRSGVLHGHAAMIDGLIRRIETELGEQVKVILTGGMSATIAPLLERLDEVSEQLTLDGLKLIHQRNRAR